MKGKKLLVATGAAVVVLGGIQFVPYGRAHTNPPARVEPSWASPETRELARRACFDCHSNETRWLWYSHIAPISWLVQHDVDEGRKELNFSEWERPQDEVEEAAEEVREGEMPPWFYVALHGEAELSAEETTELAEALARVAQKRRGDSR